MTVRAHSCNWPLVLGPKGVFRFFLLINCFIKGSCSYIFVLWQMIPSSRISVLKVKNILNSIPIVFLQSSRCVSNEQPCLRATGQHDGLWFSSRLLHFFYSIFSAPVSLSPCFPIFPSLPFLCAPQAFLKCTTKPYLYTQIERVHIIYILGNLRVFP